MNSGPIHRLSVSYGGHADAVGLIRTSAELPKRWSAQLRIVSFTVRPKTMFSGSIEPSAEDLVVEQWSLRTFDEIAKQPNDVRASIAIPDVEVVIGTGHHWREAVETSLGKPATSRCWDQARPDRRLKYSSARPPAASSAVCSRPTAG
jgi:hypothetical protein